MSKIRATREAISNAFSRDSALTDRVVPVARSLQYGVREGSEAGEAGVRS